MANAGHLWKLGVATLFIISVEKVNAAEHGSSHHTASQTQKPTEKPSPPKLPVASCSNGKTPDVNCALGSGRHHYLEHLSQIKCSELFLSIRPAWVDRVADAASKSFFAKNWWPVCSHHNLQVERAMAPGKNLASLLKDHPSQWLDMDLCAQGKKGMRGFSEYVEPTQKAYGIKVMNEAQRKTLVTEYENLRNKVSDWCCANSPQPQKCKQAMSLVKVVLCKPQTNPNVPDPCIHSRTYYEPARNVADDDLRYWWGQVTNGLKNAPVSVGRIQISPMLRLSGKPLDASASITHELGHACSAVKRQIQALNGDFAAHRQLSGSLIHPWEKFEDSSACRIDQNASSTYRSLFKSGRASLDTYNCLLGLATKAKSTRFKNGKCEGGCPQSYLEESWANWVMIQSTPVSDIGYTLQNTCLPARDNIHPLMADSLLCFLKTPSLRPFLERRIACQ